MKLQDARGETLSTVHATSAAAYDHTLDLVNSFRQDPVAILAPVLQADPDFISGHLLMAGMMLGSGDPQLHVLARASLDLAVAGKLAPTTREQSLYKALRTWADGDFDAGNRRLDRHLVDHPRDLLALQLAHLGDLMLGRTTMLRDRIARVLGHWSEDDAGYGYVLGMLAFGLEECFAYQQAEDMGRHAVALQPHDTWAIHAVAHVCEMQGRASDGIRWMNETRANWSVTNGMAVHNHWHLALMHLAGGDHAAALAIYDAAVDPSPQALALDLADASALLWRLYLRGVDVGTRWQSLARRLQQRELWGADPFTDFHALIGFTAAGDHAGAGVVRNAIDVAARQPGAPAAWATVAAPVSDAVAALVNGQHTRCAQLLLPVLPVALSIGGSHAQRDLLVLTALEAARRSGDHLLADALAAQRRMSHRLPAGVRVGSAGSPRAQQPVLV